MIKKTKTNCPQNSWSDLPTELLESIAAPLETQYDTCNFRAVCKHWRNSTSLLRAKPILHPLLPHDNEITRDAATFISCEKSILPGKSLRLVATRTFLVHPIANPKEKPWLVTLEEYDRGKVHMRHPLSRVAKEYSELPEPVLELSKYKITELFDGYCFRFRDCPQDRFNHREWSSDEEEDDVVDLVEDDGLGLRTDLVEDFKDTKEGELDTEDAEEGEQVAEDADEVETKSADSEGPSFSSPSLGDVPAGQIFSTSSYQEHGDVKEGTTVRNVDTISQALESLAESLQILQGTSARLLNGCHVEFLSSVLSDLHHLGLKVTWLERSIEKALASGENKTLVDSLVDVDEDIARAQEKKVQLLDELAKTDEMEKGLQEKRILLTKKLSLV